MLIGEIFVDTNCGRKKAHSMKNAETTGKDSRLRTLGPVKLFIPFLLLSVTLCACKTPPSPPDRAPGTKIALNYAILEKKSADDFKRLSEYVTDKENTGGNVVVRSDPSFRDGIYLILNIDIGAKVPAGSVAKLRYYRPDDHGEFVQEWELPEFVGMPTREILLGLTNREPPKNLTAWHLEVVSPDGERLIERSSFLWLDLTENPEAQTTEEPSQENEEAQKTEAPQDSTSK